MLKPNNPELKTMLSQGGCWFLARMPYLPIPEGVTTREQYRHLTRRRSFGFKFSFDRVLHVICLILLAALWAKGQTPTARATAAAPAYTEKAMVPLSVDLSGVLRVSSSGAPGGGLTDAELRATPVPMSLASVPLPTGAATETTLALVYGRLPALVSGRIPVDGSGVTQPVSNSVLTSVAGTVNATILGTDEVLDVRAVLFAVGPGGTYGNIERTNGGNLKVSVEEVIGTIPVSAASLPLPAGAATAAKQPALGTAGAASADVITVQGIASGTSMNVICVSGCSTPAENATYVWVTPDVTAGIDKLFLDLFNASGSGKIVRIRGIYPTVKTDVAVTGAVSIRFDLYRTSAVGTGGTSAAYKSATRDVAGGSIVPQDTANADLPAQITARHLPTGGATIASWTRRFSCFTEETNASTHLCSGQTNYLDITTGTQLFTLREGQGMLLKQGGVAANNNISFAVLFTLE